MRSEMSPECGKRRNAKNTAVIHIYMQIFMILFQHKERGVNMHKELYNMEQNDLLAAIYYYYSQDELPQKVQGTL